MSFSTHCMAPADWQHVQHFTPQEFHDAGSMGREFIYWLDRVREAAGVPFQITSDHRTVAHNVAVGGAEDSAHTDIPCNAVDLAKITTPEDPHGNRWRFAVVNTALRYGCTRIGIYPNGSLHLDMTMDQRPADVIWIQVDNPAK